MQRFTSAITKSLENRNWFGALFMTLCIPDLCWALESKDKEASGEKYRKWFIENLGDKYLPMFTEDDCYYFRCSCLHQGIDKHEKINYNRIHFIEPPPWNNVVHLNIFNDILQMQIDVFCNDMCQATESWYKKIIKENPNITNQIAKMIQIYPITSLEPIIVFR